MVWNLSPTGSNPSYSTNQTDSPICNKTVTMLL
jgi:hypothetical protein